MRWLTGAVIAAALIWAGYWFIGAQAVRKGAEGWFAAQPEASYQALSVQGFPNRFDLTITEPRLTDAATGLGWQSPFVQVFSLSYRPWHLIAAFAPEQSLLIGDRQIDLRAGKLQASAVAEPSAALPLERATLAGDALVVNLAPGRSVSIEMLKLASRRDDTSANGHEVAAELTGVSLSPPLPGDALPGRIDKLSLRATLAFSEPLDRFALASKPQITAVALHEANLNWGALQLKASGDLTVAASGALLGEVSLRAEGWQTLLDAAARLGLIEAEAMPGLIRAGRFLALQSGNAQVINLPVSLTETAILVMGLPVAPAVRLR